jgi:ankyrin repeat protein
MTGEIDGDIAELQNYIDNHAELNVNWQHPITGRTLPMFAAATGNPEVVGILFHRLIGYNFDLRDRDGKTVFDHARSNRNEAVIAVLETAEAEVSAYAQ